MIRDIKDNEIVLARHITKDEIKEGLSFFSSDSEYLQVGTWNYCNSKELLRHSHNEVKRTILRTHEVLYVITGSVEAQIYSLEGVLVETLQVGTGDILILLESGHGYRILEDDTKVLEIKNGPYLGAEVDRTRF